MASITLNSYNDITDALYFTTSGISPSTSIVVLKSIDAGVTFTSANFQAGLASPILGVTATVPTLFKLYSTSDNIYSNIISTETSPTFTVTRTPIENQTDISFANSPITLRLTNTATDNTIQSAYLYLWVWSGNQNKTLGNPDNVLFAEKVSIEDTYIEFEISEIIKSYIVGTNIYYGQASPSIVRNQGVFWQVIADINSTAGTLRRSFRTSFATLGYRYDFEQDASIPFSAEMPYAPRYYSNYIHDYFQQSFSFDYSVATATTLNIIDYNSITPTTFLRDAMDPCLILFLNKLGLWETFTPNGKVTFDYKKKMVTNNLSYRDTSTLDARFTHFKKTDNFDVDQSVTINTGSLEAEMVEVVKQIVLSPLVYLIKFEGDLITSAEAGTTIDSTTIKLDNQLITIDSFTIGAGYVGKYKTHRQIPVVLTDTDFTLKTRLNDKNKIDYTLKFDLTTNLINDI